MPKLKAPFPYFGGKSLVADKVWELLGDVKNYIEPFAGSAAVLLRRPHSTAGKYETINDKDGLLANFWRSIRYKPDETAQHADWPVVETDLHARHRWLKGRRKSLTESLMADPEWCDPKAAGWWCWGQCLWIGSGWCADNDCEKRIRISKRKGLVDGGGVAPINDAIKMPNSEGRGNPTAFGKAPKSKCLDGIEGGRPQLTDAYDIGRGVNSGGDYGTTEQRAEFIRNWFRELSDRLRLVRVCTGDWSRVCDSPSTTTRLGTTGVFLDPPYGDEAGRAEKLYSCESLTVAKDVREWCLRWGKVSDVRIVLAGYSGEHEELEQHGWRVIHWKPNGGYGNRSAKGKENSKKERLWASPNCNHGLSLFE